MISMRARGLVGLAAALVFFLQFFRDSVDKVGPMMATDNPDLRAFQKHGGKLVLWPGPLQIYNGRWMLIDV